MTDSVNIEDTERPEASSSQGAVSLVLIFSIATVLLFIWLLNMLIQNKFLLRKVFESIPSELQANATMNVLIATMLALVGTLTLFGLQSTIPRILSDPEKEQRATNILRGMVIPGSAVLFFVFFVYQFIFGNTGISQRLAFVGAIVSIFGFATLSQLAMANSGILVYLGIGLVIALVIFLSIPSFVNF
jgi:hypothetical protein